MDTPSILFKNRSSINSMFEVQDWGLLDYEQALEKQLQLVEKVSKENLTGILAITTHNPIVTLGRKTQTGDVFAWEGPVKEIARGGRATYHGPSQLVVYPIINLAKLSTPNDIGWYMRKLEDSIVATLAEYKITARGNNTNDPENTGVWVNDKKIASLGVGVKSTPEKTWVTYHGAAINLDYDPKAFVGMNPCGLSSSVMTSLEQVLGHKVDRAEFTKKLIGNINFRIK